MISSFSMEELTKLIYEDLEPLGYEIVLSNPSTDSVFPTIVLSTPLESISKTNNTDILQKRFQITIECWAESKYKIMQMVNEIDQILIKRNIKKTNTIADIYDDITKKHRLSSIYEVKFNGLYNSFEQ